MKSVPPINLHPFKVLGPSLGIAILLTVAGCGKGHFGSTIPANEQNVFRYSLAVDPTSLDPACADDVSSSRLMNQMFEGLVRWNADNKIVGALASSWKVSNGGSKYVFELRKGIKFSNGQEFTAADFKFSIDRACRPTVQSPTASDYLSLIDGANDEMTGKASAVSGVKVLGPFEVEIDLTTPAYYFLYDLAMPVASVVCKSAAPADKKIISVDNMVGTGPFIATKYVVDQLLTLKANPNYWGGKPKIDGISCAIVKDPQTMLTMFEQNQLDFAGVNTQNAAAVQKSSQFKDDLHVIPRAGVMYVALNEKVYPPFANRHVRRAVTMAIDTEAISQQILNGLYPQANGILPKGVPGYRDKTAILTYNLAQAKKELAEGGYPDGSKMPPVKLYFNSHNPNASLICTAIQSYLKKGLNMNISLQSMDWTTFLEQVNANRIPMYYSGWYADYLDPQDFLNLLLSTKGAENHSSYSNPQFDQLCNEAAALPLDDSKRTGMYIQAEDIALQDAAVIPIIWGVDLTLVNPRIQGLQPTALDYMPFNSISIDNK